MAVIAAVAGVVILAVGIVALCVGWSIQLREVDNE